MRLAACLSVVCLTAAAQLAPEFFAFDNATGRDQKLPLDQQAELLKRSGYAGMGLFTGTARLAELLKSLDDRGLRLLAIYVHAHVDGTGPRIDPGLAAAVEHLKSRDVMIMLTLRGKSHDDEAAVSIVREVAAMGLPVCLYPHLDFYVETAADAVRVLRKAGYKNVGVAFNLPHERGHALREGKLDADWPARVQAVREHIRLASIAGIAGANTIVRLDRSEYDVLPFLKALQAQGYRGPIALQAYNVPGDPAENLPASAREWKRLLGALRSSLR